ncbi:hypothetical protein [Klebsiella grimontii]|uniref:hypothetical protein n=1 Tax=Klebsiella grimontii TaxID=2058152 RepID=UPI001CCB060E|nr:hypothetical protein [Klebsiella grimontii]MBZ7670550.1 hypothetical protein [Klebsiella grimontii]
MVPANSPSSAVCFPGGAALTGLRVHHRLRCASAVALRLPGLRVHRRLRAGSPGKAFTPQPGDTPG